MTPQSFDVWRTSADEDELRSASEFHHHYPIELDVYDEDDDFTQAHHEVRCGCFHGLHLFGHELIGENR